ncbi:MAG: hypothetical protein QM692_22880 [Thermomicrobiales bacterium]
MDDATFDRIVQTLQGAAGRRRALTTLAGAGLLGLATVWPDDASAKRRKRKKKKKKKTRKETVTLCRDEQTITVSAQQQAAQLAAGATLGACPPCLATTANLQEAIDAAPAGTTLRLCSGRRVLTSTVTISKNFTLLGAGSDKTILDGGNAVRVLLLTDGITVTVQDLTITRGLANGDFPDDRGGGIEGKKATLTLRGVAVTDCTATGDGGGIHTFVSTLRLEAGCRITGNTGRDGGGIFNNGSEVTVDASQVSNNTATSRGGGIFDLSGANTLTLSGRSTVTGNAALTSGGGIQVQGPVTITPGSRVVNNDPDDCAGPGIVTGTCG